MTVTDQDIISRAICLRGRRSSRRIRRHLGASTLSPHVRRPDFGCGHVPDVDAGVGPWAAHRTEGLWWRDRQTWIGSCRAPNGGARPA